MTERFKISFSPIDTIVETKKCATIFEAATSLDVFIRSDCGQKGTCGKCRVIVDNPVNLSPVSKTEKKILTDSQLTSFHRLACQTKIRGPVSITIPEDLVLKNNVYGKTKIKGAFSVDHSVKRIFISPEDLKQHKNKTHSCLCEKICHSSKGKINQDALLTNPETLKKISNIDIDSTGVTLVHHSKKGITSVHKGFQKESIGLAFDIGTTTIAAYLCDLCTGEILTSKAMVNPQREFGEDVIARIAAIRENTDSLKILQELVIAGINELIKSCLETVAKSINEIDEITIVGNTTMEHILAGLNPKNMGLSPYLPVTCSPINTCALDVGLEILPDTPIYIFPVISGFLGGDILAALLADQSYQKEETVLIIDIGTNGELLLCNKSNIWATSCATGPALEGAQISCGMRAAPGAISNLFFDSKAKEPIHFKTIENKPPLGICGSGIIDALAVMRKAGITMENGTFDTSKPGVICDEKTNKKKYMIPESDIFITLKDVRQVQLAKAALFVGIESLLKKAKIKRPDLTILTGAFGARFNWQNARDIGMLPVSICKNRVESAQNLAGKGSVVALLDLSKRKEIESIAKTIHFLDLSTEPDFTSNFSNATKFPEL